MIDDTSGKRFPDFEWGRGKGLCLHGIHKLAVRNNAVQK